MPRKRKRKPQESPPEFDFHGLTAQQARDRLVSIIDRYEGRDGFLIRIIHGKGERTLAEAVEKNARIDPRVQSVEKSFFNPGETLLVLNSQRGRPAPMNRIKKWDHVPEPPVRRRKR